MGALEASTPKLGECIQQITGSEVQLLKSLLRKNQVL